MAADADDAGGHGGRHCITVLAAGQLSAIAGAAAELLPVADCDSGGLHDADPDGQRLLQPPLRLAVILNFSSAGWC